MMLVRYVEFPPADNPYASDYMTEKGIPIIYRMTDAVDGSLGFRPVYWLRCYNCNLVANLSRHDVSVQNARVTVSPSIQCPECPAHYYIKDGAVV